MIVCRQMVEGENKTVLDYNKYINKVAGNERIGKLHIHLCEAFLPLKYPPLVLSP
jgi:hypothetical protein